MDNAPEKKGSVNNRIVNNNLIICFLWANNSYESKARASERAIRTAIIERIDDKTNKRGRMEAELFSSFCLLYRRFVFCVLRLFFFYFVFFHNKVSHLNFSFFVDHFRGGATALAS